MNALDSFFITSELDKLKAEVEEIRQDQLHDFTSQLL